MLVTTITILALIEQAAQYTNSLISLARRIEAGEQVTDDELTAAKQRRDQAVDRLMAEIDGS